MGKKSRFVSGVYQKSPDDIWIPKETADGKKAPSSLDILRCSACPSSRNPSSWDRAGNNEIPKQQRCTCLLSLVLFLLLSWLSSNSHPLLFYQRFMDWYLLLPNVAWQTCGGIYHSTLTCICINKSGITSV